jgi:hypothetical protein
MLIERRIDVAEMAETVPALREAMKEHRAAARRKELRRAWIVFFSALAAGVLSIVTVTLCSEAPTGGLVMLAAGLLLGTFVLLLYAFVLFLPGADPLAHPHVKHKLHFLEELLGMLRDEVGPRTRIGLRFDMGMYAFGKLVRTATSTRGRLKQYYTDRWLQLSFTLADGTRVRVLRHAGSKTKRGAVVRLSRRLSLSIQPNGALYEPTHADTELKQVLQYAAHRAFANVPEGFHVHVQRRQQRIAIKVTQDDADISPWEVMSLLWATMGYLARRRARSA